MIRLTIATVGILLAGGIFFLYTKPLYDQVQTTQTQIAQYNTALDKSTELQTRKKELENKFNSFDPNAKDRLQKLLPDHVDNVRLILDLDSLAGRYGLSLQNVDVSSSDSKTASTQTAVGAIGGSNQKYDSLTLTFGTTATYGNFIQFLTDLESSLRIVDLVSLSMTSVATPPGSTSSEPLYAYNITLRTYWLK